MLVGTADGDLALMNYSAGNTHIVATSNLLAGREQWRRERKRRRKCRRRKKRAEERSRQRPHLRNRTNLVNEGDDGNGGHVGGKGDTKANGEEGETNRVSLQTWRTKMLKRMYHPIDKKRHDDNDTVVNVHYERQPNNEEGDMTDSTNADGNAYNGGKLALKKSFKKARSDSPHSALYLESGACVTDGDDDSVNVNADMDDRSRDDHKNAILGICWLHDHYSYSPSIHASTVSSSSPLASSFASSSFFIASSGAGRTLLYNTGYVYDGNSTVDTDSGGVGAFNGSSDHNFYNVRACNVYSPNRKYSTRSNFIAGKGDTAGNRGVLYDVNRCKKESHASLQVVHDYGVLMKDVTSCHVNADDRMIVSSGYCKDVVISDLHTGDVSCSFAYASVYQHMVLCI